MLMLILLGAGLGVLGSYALFLVVAKFAPWVLLSAIGATAAWVKFSR